MVLKVNTRWMMDFYILMLRHIPSQAIKIWGKIFIPFWPLCCESFYCIINFPINNFYVLLMWHLVIFKDNNFSNIYELFNNKKNIEKLWQWKMSFIEFPSRKYGLYFILSFFVTNTNIVSMMKMFRSWTRSILE